ncbi:hypothetical protein TraAM80_08144, partial [Trypanosoma rangeli]
SWQGALRFDLPRAPHRPGAPNQTEKFTGASWPCFFLSSFSLPAPYGQFHTWPVVMLAAPHALPPYTNNPPIILGALFLLVFLITSQVDVQTDRNTFIHGVHPSASAPGLGVMYWWRFDLVKGARLCVDCRSDV